MEIYACKKVDGLCMNCFYADMCPYYNEKSEEKVLIDTNGVYKGVAK